MRKLAKSFLTASCLAVLSLSTGWQMQSAAVDAASSSSSSDSYAWYENTGDSIPEGYTPDYSQYNLLSTVQKGDIVYMPNSGYGITGHVTIVEGTFYDTAQKTWYIRTIEANWNGVYRSILEDTCVNDKAVQIYRVNDATSTDIDNAVNFCIGELGSSYNLDFAHDYSADETDWYCSELVWAAYYNQGIDIETTGTLNEPGITPRDIARSSAVTEINFK